MIVISDIMYYGRYYKNEKAPNEINWWFCNLDSCIYSTDNLFESYGFKNCDEIESTGVYIAVFRTDMEKLKKEFMYKYVGNDKEIIRLLDENKKYDYCVAFRVFIDGWLNEDWHLYERKRLQSDAISWCKKNGIPFKNTEDG